MVVLVLLVGFAAFTAGRMLNQNVSTLGLLGFGGRGGVMDKTINLVPAKELPTDSPQIVGLFAGRADNVIFVETTSLKTGGQGIVVHQDEKGNVSPSSNMNYGPKEEVVVSKDTKIFRDATPPVEPSTNNATIQQVVQESSLDDLSSESFVNVWGRKSGDRIIAEVVLIHTPVLYNRP
jgi:hypothetical protein